MVVRSVLSFGRRLSLGFLAPILVVSLSLQFFGVRQKVKKCIIDVNREGSLCEVSQKGEKLQA